MVNKEIHPDWYHPVLNMHSLILGTYPPHKDRWDFPFYYPNNMNRFWKVMAKIADFELKESKGLAAVKERMALMDSLSVGVQNVGLVINRKGKSAKDRDIEIVEFQDLIGTINSSKNLKSILLTGYSDTHSTFNSFIRYLELNQLPNNAPKKPTAGHIFTIDCGRQIDCLIGNSTSTLARTVSFETLVEQFRKVIIG